MVKKTIEKEFKLTRTYARTYTYIKNKNKGLTETRTRINEKILMPYKTNTYQPSYRES